MTPLFKTDCSLGKSILTLDPKDERSIFSLDGLGDEIVLVEDEMSGVFEAVKLCNEQGKRLRFGVRMVFADRDNYNETWHRNVIFAKNAQGMYDLMKVHSLAKENGGFQTYDGLKNLWTKNLKICVPFYDSYVFNNLLRVHSSYPDFPEEPTFFVEDNGHPFDGIVKKKLETITSKTEEVKSIYYKRKEDFLTWQTFKIACNRVAYKSVNIQRPELEYCSSNEFCWESYVERNS